jgi:hypothetical protein
VAIRRGRIAFAILLTVAAAAAIGIAVYLSTSDTYVARPQGYELSADALHITVAFCGSNADTIAAQTVREDDRSVAVGIRLRQTRGVFQSGAVHKVTFALTAPLGSRVVTDDGGTAVPPGSQFLCPG